MKAFMFCKKISFEQVRENDYIQTHVITMMRKTCKFTDSKEIDLKVVFFLSFIVFSIIILRSIDFVFTKHLTLLQLLNQDTSTASR